jgi:hypothetical protein
MEQIEKNGTNPRNYDTSRSPWKSLQDLMIRLNIIDDQFTGSITFHFNQGGLGEIEKLEKSLKKKLNSCNKLNNNF